MLTVGQDLTKMTIPELYAYRNQFYAARDRTDVPEEKARIKREMGRVGRLLSKRGLPKQYNDYRAGLHLWRDNLDFLWTLHTSEGQSIKDWQFVETMKHLALLPGHSYRIYALYRVSNIHPGRRLFKRLKAIDVNALTSPVGNWRMLGTLEL